MDTKTFLLERSQLVHRLETRRQTFCKPERRPSSGWGGLSAGGLGGLLLNFAASKTSWGWITKFLLTTGVPLAMGWVQGRRPSFWPRKRFSSRLMETVLGLWKRR